MSTTPARWLGRLVLAGVGAALARTVVTAVRTAPQPGLERINFRGRAVSLAAGPALAAAASVTAAAGAAAEGRYALARSILVAGLGAGAVGFYDDTVGSRPEHAAKGFRGHVGALRDGRVTSGLVKVVGVGATSLAASAILPSRRRRVGSDGRLRKRRRLSRALDVALGAGVIAGMANLVNLLDLRPGRALKAGLIVGVPLAATDVGGAVAGPVGAAAAMLPDDLSEHVMIGDSGANALGAVLGVALAARTGILGRATLLAALSALTAASEKVSFTKVIEGTPGLREFDQLGRSG
jgi:UDP-N-acetylmuramyl pentapeptide phosphotransferase/UDP-N-acetylglucosamine-1-phosphate transferase